MSGGDSLRLSFSTLVPARVGRDEYLTANSARRAYKGIAGASSSAADEEGLV